MIGRGMAALAAWSFAAAAAEGGMGYDELIGTIAEEALRRTATESTFRG